MLDFMEFDSGQSILFCMVSAGVNVCLVLLDRDTRPAGYFQDFEIGGHYVVACIASIYKFCWRHYGISKHSFL